jgi:hypothetical protein
MIGRPPFRQPSLQPVAGEIIMSKILSLSVLLAVTLVPAVPAWAGPHGHAHFGIEFGPLWAPWYYPPPYYYPPVVVQAAPPPVYVEPSAPPPVYVEQAPAPQNYWYFCPASNQYYPYVRNCPVPWQKVAPQPASGQ